MDKRTRGQEACKRYREKLIAVGLCTTCGKQPTAEQTRKCQQCLDKGRKYARDWHRDQYAAWKAAGLCAYCGRVPVTTTVRCDACATKQNAKQRPRAKRKHAKYIENKICTACHKVAVPAEQTRCVECRAAYQQSAKVRNRRIKDAAFAAYGGYICSCCGETHEEFLQIDHVAGDGAQHRRDDPTAFRIYAWLKRHGYPATGFRVLCSNCNWSRARYGYCPHQRSTDGLNVAHSEPAVGQ